MTERMKLVVVGAGGRMGRMLVRAVLEHPETILHGALERDGSPVIGQDAGLLAETGTAGITITSDVALAFAGADGVLDFTAPDATVAFAQAAAARGLVHVIGTTGCAASHDSAIRQASAQARIVKSGNMSLGVNLLAMLVQRAAAALGSDWDIEVLEMHHRRKVDAPSGTALLLGQAAADGRGVTLADAKVSVRDGHTGPRREGSIGFATLRGGSVVGDHSVILAGEGERITLSHHAEDRGLFARGAVKAALWARGQSPGLYDMFDVLGLKA
jgi:4-hydroxy-tetrahydrodipicolinate reductase